MKVYYNEWDKFAAAWLKQLIYFGAIPDGDIDERSITEVSPSDLAGYDQCHFFAGIGGWAHALDLAKWRGPVWTGSCPCQPFSVAGAQAGTKDKRHLWPELRRLITKCAPPVVFGEQVASRLGREWLARVRAEMEALDYAFGAADLCAAGVSAPHIRQRLYWVGQSQSQQQQHGCRDAGNGRREFANASAYSHRVPQPIGGQRQWVSDTDSRNNNRHAAERDQGHGLAQSCGDAGLGFPNNKRLEIVGIEPARRERASAERSGTTGSWERGVFVPCLDGKARRVEPGIFPLADGFPNRVGTLRGSGNAIVPEVAKEFITAFMEATDGQD